MKQDTRRRIHAFRNALVLAADTRSHECFHMPRWNTELNNFPGGGCDLASNFLAQYLRDSDPTLQPDIIHMQATQSFRDEEKSTVYSHVIVALGEEYIDLTLSQFAEYSGRVVIEDKFGTLHTLLSKIKQHEGTVTGRGINIDSASEEGEALYGWLRHTADRLLTRSCTPIASSANNAE